jgi:hypothetical protein
VLAVAELSQVSQNQFEKAAQYECDDQDRKDFRSLVPQEIKRIVAPVIDYLKKAVWGHKRPHCMFSCRADHRWRDYSNALEVH